MKLEHVAINVPEPIKFAEWYANNLDANVVRGEDKAPYAHFIADSEGNTIIEVYHNPAGEIPNYSEMSPFTLHIAYLVDDMEGTRNRLIEAGATADGEIATTPAKDQLAFLRDPWGITIQLVKRNTPLM